MNEGIYRRAQELGLISGKEDIENMLNSLGDSVFFEMACSHLGYNSFLSEIAFVDYITTSPTETEVTLDLNEVGKVPNRVKFKVIIQEDSKDNLEPSCVPEQLNLDLV